MPTRSPAAQEVRSPSQRTERCPEIHHNSQSGASELTTHSLLPCLNARHTALIIYCEIAEPVLEETSTKLTADQKIDSNRSVRERLPWDGARESRATDAPLLPWKMPDGKDPGGLIPASASQAPVFTD